MPTVNYIHTIPYTPQDGVMRPKIVVRLNYGGRYFDTQAVVDSGADISVFPLLFARLLGVDLSNCSLAPVKGAFGSAEAYLCAVDLTVYGKFFQAPAFFVDDLSCPVLLGRQGVFDKMQLGFNEARVEYYLTMDP